MAPRTTREGRRDCACPKARHRHGTVQAYKLDRCGCQPCRDAKTAYDNAYNHRTGRSTAPVPADRARAHLETLVGAGMTTVRVAEVSGVSPDTIRRVLNGKNPRIYRDVQDLILAVPPERGAGRCNYVPGTGTRRRLQGLAVLGWGTQAVADHAGVNREWVQELRVERPRDVERATADMVARVTRELVQRPAPTGSGPTLARRHAAASGWVSLFAYDDLDDPDETPNVTVLQPRRGNSTVDAAARLDDLVHLVEGGTPVEEAVTRSGYPSLKAAYEAARHQGNTTLMPLLVPRRWTA